MALHSGTRLGPYEVTAPLGAGGMGEVYRARDTRLDRTVAIKVLPADLAANAERRHRFEREARAISALNHPHICVLHDVGHQDGVDFLVMEHLEGETLADRLKKGALPIDQVLRYGVEIAEALARAHRQGIVHRDLKPGNVMLTKSGTKLLDFGLAKLRAAPGTASGDSELSSLPTGDKPLTAEGSIVGTFQYMAPEQLEGKEPDARTDIFALGTVLYEMATGQRPFTGKSQASLIGAILKEDPAPISRIQPLTPPALDRAVATCLAKEPDERWQDAHDLANELKWIAAVGVRADAAGGARGPRIRRERLAWAGVSLALATSTAVLAWNAVRGTPAPPKTAVRFHLLPPPGAAFTPTEAVGAPHIAVSAGGERLALVAAVGGGRPLLWVRGIDALEPVMLAGTEDASFPFWSPDGTEIGFFAQGKLRKVAMTGGAAQVLCDAPQGRGGSWSRGGVILFTPNINDPLHRVSAAGGVAAPVTRLDEGAHETSHRWPQFLPDGKRFVFFVRSADRERTGVYLGSLDGPDRALLLKTDAGAAYAPPGYLLALRGESLMAQPIDLDAGRLAGEPVPVVERLGHSPDFNYAAFSVSQTGTLVYGAATIAPKTALMWLDRSGKRLGSAGPEGEFSNPSLAPDLRRIAAARLDRQAGTRDIWLFDAAGGTGTRFSFDPGDDAEPMWSPDARLVAFRSNRDGHGSLYRKPSAGTGNEERMFESQTGVFPTDWSRDGKRLVYQSPGAKTGWNLWVLDIDERAPQPYLQTPFNEMLARWSPDGRWIAYVSDEQGARDVYVQSFPSSGGKWQVSTQGGSEPTWRADGRELFFVSRDRKLMAVSVRAGDTFEAGTPAALFDIHTPVVTAPFGSTYAAAPDGQRFLVNSVVEGASPASITVVLNGLPGTLR